MIKGYKLYRFLCRYRDVLLVYSLALMWHHSLAALHANLQIQWLQAKWCGICRAFPHSRVRWLHESDVMLAISRISRIRSCLWSQVEYGTQTRRCSPWTSITCRRPSTMKACFCLFLVHWLTLLNTARPALEPGAETTLRYTLIRANSPDCLPSPPAESYPVLVQYMPCRSVGDTTETDNVWRELESIPGWFSQKIPYRVVFKLVICMMPPWL